MAFEDELFGALKPVFRPRVFGDPNLKYAKQIVSGTGQFAPHHASAPASASPRSIDVRAVLARVVRKSPEVVVKVTGRKKGAAHVAAHLDYIGRKGEIAIETRDGEEIKDKADIARIAEEWGDTASWRKGTSVSAVSMVFSMTQGTDPETVKQAVRDAADRMIGDNHDYLMALHVDTDRPHVHLTVQAEGLNRKRFDPRREDLFKFREAFAEALRSRGVEAEATPRYSRGQGKAGVSMALTQMRAKILSGASRQPTDADMKQAREAMMIALGKGEQPAFVAKAKERWEDTRQRYEAAAEWLERSGNRADRALAGDVRAFLQERPTIETVPDRALREATRRVKAAQERQEGQERPQDRSQQQQAPRTPERPHEGPTRDGPTPYRPAPTRRR
ncbi:relaxase/mobilization nuclease domain-containing protein [Sphingomonas sp. FARSPH]|uniref:relaxase/mobilization nuclease domain-containing protein n=1 Tax=Sphingomonas sp. FARSPH TaxID=2219696 RepID=UPI000E107AC7|nr:relaxase/mobilization nuclease domain-containing protein [Sphingomonas sp. FARSPH]AXJ97512.1 relaxase [Sphingomonas sp. FARSPH]